MTTTANTTLTLPTDPDEPTLLNHLYLANRSVEKKADLNEMRLNARRSKDGRFLVFSDDMQMKFRSRFEELKEMGKPDEEPWYKSLIQFRFFADLFTARDPDTAYQSNEKLANYMGHQKRMSPLSIKKTENLMPLLIHYAAMDAKVTYELGLGLALLLDTASYDDTGHVEWAQFRTDVLRHFEIPFFVRDSTITALPSEWTDRMRRDA